jgi:hypothetical protein
MPPGTANTQGKSGRQINANQPTERQTAHPAPLNARTYHGQRDVQPRAVPVQQVCPAMQGNVMQTTMIFAEDHHQTSVRQHPPHNQTQGMAGGKRILTARQRRSPLSGLSLVSATRKR